MIAHSIFTLFPFSFFAHALDIVYQWASFTYSVSGYALMNIDVCDYSNIIGRYFTFRANWRKRAMLASQIMLSLTGSEDEITANHICRTANINIHKRIVKHAVQLARLQELQVRE